MAAHIGGLLMRARARLAVPPGGGLNIVQMTCHSIKLSEPFKRKKKNVHCVVVQAVIYWSPSEACVLFFF